MIQRGLERNEGPSRGAQAPTLKGNCSLHLDSEALLEKHPRNICSLDSFPSVFMLKRNHADASVMPSFLIGKQTQTLL